MNWDDLEGMETKCVFRVVPGGYRVVVDGQDERHLMHGDEFVLHFYGPYANDEPLAHAHMVFGRGKYKNTRMVPEHPLPYWKRVALWLEDAPWRLFWLLILTVGEVAMLGTVWFYLLRGLSQ